MSGAGISDISGDASSKYSPNKLPMLVNKSISPPLNQRHCILIQQRSVPTGLVSSKPVKFQLPRYAEIEQIYCQESETAFCTHRTEYKDLRSHEDQFGSSYERKSLINRGNSNESSGTGCGSTS